MAARQKLKREMARRYLFCYEPRSKGLIQVYEIGDEIQECIYDVFLAYVDLQSVESAQA